MRKVHLGGNNKLYSQGNWVYLDYSGFTFKLDAGRNDSIYIYKDNNTLYVLSENNNLNYVSLTVFSLDNGATIGDIFIQDYAEAEAILGMKQYPTKIRYLSQWID